MHDTTIVFHIGAPYTDEGQLIWSLRKDAKRLVKNGCMVKRPAAYRDQVTDLLHKQSDDTVTDQERDELLQTLIGGQSFERYFLWEPGILGAPAWMLNTGCMFKNAGRNTGELRELFHANECEFHLGIRNPATLIPVSFSMQKDRTWNDFLSGSDLLSLRWSDVVQDILDFSPDCPVTIWCNEETPVIWPEIMGAVAGAGADFRFSGELDVISKIMPAAALEKLQAYLADRPDLTEAQRLQVRGVFLEHFVADEEVEEEIDLPGWTQELVDTMTAVYEDDIELMRQMEGVRFIG